MADSSGSKQRVVLGVAMTAQAVALALAAVLAAALVGLAVLSWLERVG